MNAIVVPDEFAEQLVRREGAAARAWIDALPDAVGDCCDRWALAPDGAALHGHDAVVVPVRRADGGGAMLKLAWPGEGARHEADALAAWAGRGAVRLLARDGGGVLLLERLDPSRSLRELDGVAAASIAGQLCRRLAVPAPPGLPGLADVVAAWAVELPREWERLGRPLDRRPVEAAVATCRELGPDQPRLLLHGNLHSVNVLRGGREPWLAIDPNGIAGDPASEVAPLLGERWSELTARGDPGAVVRDRLAAFTAGAGVDPQRVRRWAHALTVREALWCHEHQPEFAPRVAALVERLG